LRVSLPGVTSAASVSVDVLAGRAVEVVAGAFALTHDLPFALDADETASRVKWSKKTNALTVSFRREKVATVQEAVDLDPDNLYVCADPEGKKGRVLRAARDVEEGEIVMVCEPIAAAVHDDAALGACAECFASSPLFSCARCETRYCDARCAARDVAHEGECALVARLGGASKIRGARMFLRLLYLRLAKPAAFGKTDVWRASPKVSGGGPEDASVLGSVKFLQSVLPKDALPADPDYFVRAARENLHGVVRKDGTLVGSAAYAAASLANHACDPNCVASFLTGDDDDDDELSRMWEETRGRKENRKPLKPLFVMRATRPLKKREEVTLGYVELYSSRGERRARLKKTKGFLCLCARCLDPPDSDRFLTGWLCRCSVATAGCPGVATHDAFEANEKRGASIDGKEEDVLRCVSCGAETVFLNGGASRASASSAETVWRGVIERARDAARRGDHSLSFALASEALRETKTVLHDAHVVRHELRLALAAAAERLEKWTDVADACAATTKHMARVVSARHPGLLDQRATLSRAIEKGGGLSQTSELPINRL
jgi:hypothetical protein